MAGTEHNQELDGLAAMAHAQYAAVLRDAPFGPPTPYAQLPHIHRDAWRAGAGAVARASTVGHDLVRDFGGPRPEIVVLCGSTRFVDEFNRQRKELTEAGAIVLSIEVVTTQARDVDPQHANPDLKRRLDELHLRKIDLADRVLVLDVGGYIGESTRREIAYATGLGKPIRYLSQTTDAELAAEPAALPVVYIGGADCGPHGDVAMFAVADDGEVIAQHVCSHRGYGLGDLHTRKRGIYEKKFGGFGDGEFYRIVEVKTWSDVPQDVRDRNAKLAEVPDGE